MLPPNGPSAMHWCASSYKFDGNARNVDLITALHKGSRTPICCFRCSEPTNCVGCCEMTERYAVFFLLLRGGRRNKSRGEIRLLPN